MTKGNRVYRGQPCPDCVISSSALAGTRLASGKLSRDRKGDEKGWPARPQFDGLLAQAENENAVSRPFSPHPACFLLSIDGMDARINEAIKAQFDDSPS